MKKIVKILKNNLKTIVAVIVGVIISGTTAYTAATITTADVSYNKNGQTTAEGALDDLYTKANTPAAPTTITAPGGTVFAMVTGTKGYACNSNINGKLLCVRNGPNNTDDYNARKAELEKACTAVGGSFYSSSSSASCSDSSSDFNCSVYSNGFASCRDDSSNHYCTVIAGGSVSCN